MRFPIKINPKIITPEELKIVWGNFLSLSTLQSLNYVLPIIILPYLIRVIGAERFGLIAFAQAFVQYFMILTDYGFSLSATRKISLCKEHKQRICTVFSSVLTVKFILSIASFLILLVMINFIPKFKTDWLVYILSFGAVIGNTLFPIWFFQGTEKMKYIAIINITCGAFYVLGIFMLVRSPADYLWFPALSSMFSLVTGIWGLRVAFRKFGLEFVFQTYHSIKEELRAGWDIFTSMVAINAYTATRIFVVGLLTNNTITGYYSIADKIAGFIQTFPLASFSQAVYPRLSRVFVKNKDRALRFMNRAQDITTATGVVCLPVIFVFTPQIVKLICGTPFPEVILTMRLLIFSIFFISANAFKVQFLLVCGRADSYARIHISMACVGLPLLFLLVDSFSYKGAAMATIITEAGIYILTFITIRKLT